MAMLAAHINDAAITVIDGDQLLYREPGFALLEEGGIATGLAAERASRLHPRRISSQHWDELNTSNLSLSRYSHLTPADLVSQQLEQIWQRAGATGKELLVAIPAYMSRESLSLFLGIADELGIRVAGIVDSAAAATRRQYTNATPVHVEISLHRACLTRLQQDDQALVERSEVIDNSGLVQLNDAWIRTISSHFVQQSRFDPLHTAETEQALLDQLPQWLARSSRADSVAMSVEYRGIQHDAEISSLDLVSAAAPVYQRIAGQLRALLRAGETPAIQLSDRAASLPGLAAMLSARAGGEVFLLEPGATARGLLKRFQPDAGSGSAFKLRKSLPFDQAAVELDTSAEDDSGELPTHLLFDHVAYPVGDEPLVLGSQPGDGARWIDFGQTLPGLSRRHCSISRSGGQCVVEDHSRYGTFLNGHRIEGSAVLQSGDTVRVGTPGVELTLIRTAD